MHYHLLALFVTIVWGATFVSTKVILQHGLTPSSIFFYRFLMAWIMIWIISPKRLWANSLKDELLFMVLGVTGGSVYFLAENTALKYTLASNVSLIICTAPLITAFLINEKITPVALLGAAFIVGGVYWAERNQVTDK